MRKVCLFIAMSLDGYIADINGSVDWLKGQDTDRENINSYSEFIKNIDTVLMGWNTYYQIVTELSPDKWVYEGMTTYVITHREYTSSENIRFVNTNPLDLLNKLKAEDGKDIWICGGAKLAQQLICNKLIDLYHISVIPTILGSGIRLFGEYCGEINLRLIKTQTYNGITDIVYVPRQ